MNKFLLWVLFCFTLMVPSLSEAADFVYAGRFYLRSAPPIAHNADLFLVNHLYNKKGNAEDYMPYDVYYVHDHATDTGDNDHEYANQSFTFTVKIIPLNIYNKPMGEGLFAGTIMCDYTVAAGGTYGVDMKKFSVVDTETGKVLFTANGAMGSESLYEGSAAEFILQATADHPVVGGKRDQLRGVVKYPYR